MPAVDLPFSSPGPGCSGLLRSGGRGGEHRALFSFPQCQGCSPLPGPDQPWESGYLGCEGLSFRGLNKKPLNTLKLREVSNLSAGPHSRPPRDGLSSVLGYRGFLISPSSDKLLIKRALPPIPLRLLLPLPGDPREGLKAAAAGRGLRASSMRRQVGSLARCPLPRAGVPDCGAEVPGVGAAARAPAALVTSG